MIGPVRRWFGRRAEVREASTDALLAAALSGAAAAIRTDGLGAVEACVGLISRSMALARIDPPVSGLGPVEVASMIRTALTRGEAVSVIEVEAGGVRLRPAAAWDVRGGRRWWYRCDLPTPDGLDLLTLPAEGVVHFRLSPDPATPWAGVPPLRRAAATASLTARIEAAFKAEFSIPAARLLPVPAGATTEVITGVRADIEAAAGRVAMPELGAGGGVSPAVGQREWSPVRIGSDLPQASVQARAALGETIHGVFGVPTELLTTGGEGSGSTAAWRRLVSSVLDPYAAMLAAELSMKLERPVSVSLERLGATDAAPKARAYGVLVGAGMDPARAESLVGLAAAP